MTLQMEQQILQMYDVAENKSLSKKLHRWRNNHQSSVGNENENMHIVFDLKDQVDPFNFYLKISVALNFEII